MTSLMAAQDKEIYNYATLLGSSSYKNMHMQAYMYMYMYTQGNIIQHMETHACVYTMYKILYMYMYMCMVAAI